MSIKVVLYLTYGVIFIVVPLVVGIICLKGGRVLGKYVKSEPMREEFQYEEDYMVSLKDYKSLRHLITLCYVIGVWCFIHILSMIGFVFIMSDFVSNF